MYVNISNMDIMRVFYIVKRYGLVGFIENRGNNTILRIEKTGRF
jgi:hypothetical protein